MKQMLTLVLLTALVSMEGLPGSHGVKVRPVDPPETGEDASGGGVVRGIPPHQYAIGPGDSLGYTVSDYATNRSTCHNLINYGDGAFSLGRMAAAVGDPIDRGTYYSFSNDGGMSWTPLSWAEGTRQGWGNIDQFEDAGGTEVIVSHTGLQVCIDADRGANVWTCSSTGVATDLWPRITVTSPFNIHIVHADANPPTNIWYTRSTDAGATFDILDSPIFFSPGFLPEADAYDIASYGSNVAIVLAPSDNIISGDVLLARSTDDGSTWTEEVIFDTKGLGELPTGEEEHQPDGCVAAIYDNAGNLHIVWTTFLAVGNATNDPELFYDIDAPLMYWSEATGLVKIDPSVQDTTIVKVTNNFGNLVTQPDIGVDENDNIFIMFQQSINEQDAALNYLQHIYATGSMDGGFTWREPIDITPGTGFDASFGSMADRVDSNVYITYFSDPFAGNAVRGNHDTVQVAVMYLTSPAIDLITGVRQETDTKPVQYQLGQNYPNPFNPSTKIRYTIPAQSQVNLAIFDVLGRAVATLVDEEQAPGSHEVVVDAAALSNGTYFYRLRAGTFSETKKMIVLK
jgi:hypothetical protein